MYIIFDAKPSPVANSQVHSIDGRNHKSGRKSKAPNSKEGRGLEIPLWRSVLGANLRA